MLKELKACGVSLKSAWAPSGPGLSSSGPGQHAGWPAGHRLALGKGMKWAAITKACSARRGGTVWRMRSPSRRARPSRTYGDLLSRGTGRACPGSSGPARRPPASPHLECWALCERATEPSVRPAASPIGWRAGWGQSQALASLMGPWSLSGSLSSGSHLTAASHGVQQPSGIQRSSEPVAPRRLPKNSLRESLENVGALSKTLFLLTSSSFCSSRASSSWPRLQFRKFSEACAGLLAECITTTPPPDAPRISPRKALGFPPRWLRLSGGWLWFCQPLQSWTRRRPPWSRKSGTSTWGQQQRGRSQVAEWPVEPFWIPGWGAGREAFLKWRSFGEQRKRPRRVLSAEPGLGLCILRGEPPCYSPSAESGAPLSHLSAVSSFSSRDQLGKNEPAKLRWDFLMFWTWASLKGIPLPLLLLGKGCLPQSRLVECSLSLLHRVSLEASWRVL